MLLSGRVTTLSLARTDKCEKKTQLRFEWVKTRRKIPLHHDYTHCLVEDEEEEHIHTYYVLAKRLHESRKRERTIEICGSDATNWLDLSGWTHIFLSERVTIWTQQAPQWWWYASYARLTLSQLWSLRIHGTTFLNYMIFADLLISRLWNCVRAGRVSGETDRHKMGDTSPTSQFPCNPWLTSCQDLLVGLNFEALFSPCPASTNGRGWRWWSGGRIVFQEDIYPWQV